MKLLSIDELLEPSGGRGACSCGFDVDNMSYRRDAGSGEVCELVCCNKPYYKYKLYKYELSWDVSVTKKCSGWTYEDGLDLFDAIASGKGDDNDYIAKLIYRQN